jgi:nicotinate-nucleotide adenylyltransferase
MTTVGLLGGTFDPIHNGHLDVARAARLALALDEVWLVPACCPPHRTRPVASAAHRFAMAALAVSGDPSLRISDAEMDTDGPSFTIDTLDRLEAQRPSLVGSLVFITGADAFRDIRTWRRWQELLERCHFAVISRAGSPAGDLRRDLPELADRMQDSPCTVTPSPGIFLIEAKTADVSSTQVRQGLAAGNRLAGLLPEAVAEYAVRHGLYADAAVLETSRG